MSTLISIKDSLAGGFSQLLSAVPDLPIYLCLVIFLYGVYKQFLEGEGGYYLELLEDYANTPSDEDRFFIQFGSKLTANKYTILLYMIAFALFFMSGIVAATSGNISSFLKGLLFSLALIVFLKPKDYLYKEIKSPFFIITEFFSKRRSQDYDRELFNSVTTLKNLAIAQEDDALSADLMLEKLMDNSKKLKPIYAQTISIYRSGDKTKALKFFSDAIGTKNGKAFAMTLEKIDKIDPSELRTQVLSLQEIMSEERYTKGLEKAESKGTLIYAMATGVCLICLLNFLFVCVIMDTLSLMGDMF